MTGGKAFEQPGRQRDLTSQEKQDIEVFGRITERTQNRMMTEHNYTMESWTVVDEMPGTWRLQRPQSASQGRGHRARGRPCAWATARRSTSG